MTGPVLGGWRVHSETCSNSGVAIASTEEQRAVQASIRRWATDADTLAAVRAGESPARYWADLAKLGLFGLATGEPEASALDLAAALEQVTDSLVPGPIMPTLLAGVALSPYADRPAVAKVLAAVGAGNARVAVALTPGTVEVAPVEDGGWRLSGRVGPVLGGGATTQPEPGTSSFLLLGTRSDRWLLVEADRPGVTLTARTPVDFSRTLADVALSDVVIAADSVFDAPVLEIAAFLAAVEASAVAGWCVRTATRYARERRQFGRPIGSFQAVKHLCAGMLCRAERASALAWDAAVAYDQAPEEFPLVAAAAASVALDAGVDNAKDCIQVLGGIGFTWEHDAHLYLRRAVALRQLLGGSVHWRQTAARRALTGARRTLRYELAADVEAQRPAVRTKAVEISALAPDQRRAALVHAGWLTPGWAPPYGQGASVEHQLLIDEELGRVDVVRPDLAIAGWAVPTILAHGSPAQRERFAGPSLLGEITWCQLFSEPEAGSDLASLRTAAVKVEGGWRVTGQKVWTSLARQADWGICLARTDPEAPKHKGLSYLLVKMDSQGVDIRPLREITGESVFNEVFLDEVFVPDDCLVGAPGDGWRLARSTLDFERVAIGRGSSLGEGVEALLSTAVGRRDPHGAVVGQARADGLAQFDPDLDRLGALIADGLTVSILDFRGGIGAASSTSSSGSTGGSSRTSSDASNTASIEGRNSGTSSSTGSGTSSAVRKLIGVAHRQAVAEAALEFCGPDGAATDGPSAGPVHQFLLTRCLSIAGGTTQILLNVVAERVLGLPREGVG
jgi:alkylation response protein AidB-like acyl-CoA dehydrogenase